MVWIIYALCAAIMGAVYNLTAQNIKLNRSIFMIYRGVIPMFVLWPFVAFFWIDFGSVFVMISILQGFISAYIDFLTFNINRRYGSEVISAIAPFSVIVTFFLWCAITPMVIVGYAQNIFQFCLILMAIFGVAFSLFQYHHVEFTQKAFIKMLPVVLLSGIFVVLNKIVMNRSATNQLICACQNVFISSTVVGIIHLYRYQKKSLPLKNLILPQNLIKGTTVFSFFLLLIIFKLCAVHYARNPAYASCVFYSMILWVMLFSRYIPALKFSKIHFQGKKRWKILFVCSIVLLILVTAD